MNLADEYRLSEYQDPAAPDDAFPFRLRRRRRDGVICVEKRVPAAQADVYAFLASHPGDCLPMIYERIEDGEELIILEEYAEGQTLEEMTAAHPFTQEDAVRIICTLCEALRPLHQADPPLICRDLKAENIIMCQDGSLKIIDFDIARRYDPGRTRDTQLLGTPEYAAPEQYGYGQSDARTDIYALGVLLNYLMLGKFPAEESLPEPIGGIIRTCTRMDPDQRYQDVDALRQALQDLSEHQISETGRRRSFLPPGFRSGNICHMITAFLGYTLLCVFIFSIDVTASGTTLPAAIRHLEQAFLLLAMLIWIFIVFNYRGIRQHLPLVKNARLPVRLIGYAAALVILFYAAVSACVLTEALLL